MSLSLSQILSDAKRLSSRLRDHDSSADALLTSAGDVLKEVESMRQFQEELDQLNAVAQQRPRANLVLGIQQENRHIRQLQQENKELRAALEEQQNALELIMSKYRQHMEYLVNTTKIDKNLVNQQKSMLLQEKTDRICEMASVMTKSIQLDEEGAARDEEVKTRLVTENKGLREMLEISRRNGSYCDPLCRPKVISRETQTVKLPEPSTSSSSSSSSSSSKPSSSSTKTTALSSLHRTNGDGISSSEHATAAEALSAAVAKQHANNGKMNGGDTDSDDDEEITFNTIKRRVNGNNGVGKKPLKELVNGDKGGGGGNSSGEETDETDSSVSSVIEAAVVSKAVVSKSNGEDVENAPTAVASSS